jgi:hypothetical protein
MLNNLNLIHLEQNLKSQVPPKQAMLFHQLTNNQSSNKQ